MNTSATAQLEAIHSMMASGHRSVRLERHTLLLWGVASALLIIVTDMIFHLEQFKERWVFHFVVTAFISTVLLTVGIIDYRLTRRARAHRGETLSFVQKQVTKVWWLLIGLIVLLELGMNFFGGGFMFYGLVLALMGLAFYVQGLFSQQMLSWIGVLLIVLGLGSIAIQLPFLAQKWLAASTLGLGLPLLALVLDCPAVHGTPVRRALFSVAWLCLMALPTAAAYHFTASSGTQDLKEISLTEFLAAPGDTFGLAVRLPAGSAVPVLWNFSGGVLSGKNPVMNLNLDQDVVVALDGNGKPSGVFKPADGRWRKVQGGISFLVDDIKADLDPHNGPRITIDSRIEIP